MSSSSAVPPEQSSTATPNSPATPDSFEDLSYCIIDEIENLLSTPPNKSQSLTEMHKDILRHECGIFGYWAATQGVIPEGVMAEGAASFETRVQEDRLVGRDLRYDLETLLTDVRERKFKSKKKLSYLYLCVQSLG